LLTFSKLNYFFIISYPQQYHRSDRVASITIVATVVVTASTDWQQLTATRSRTRRIAIWHVIKAVGLYWSQVRYLVSVFFLSIPIFLREAGERGNW